jgi:hypothetical protein
MHHPRFMHHPRQISEPDWSSTADSDPDMARRTREHMLTRLADAPIVVISHAFRRPHRRSYRA